MATVPGWFPELPGCLRRWRGDNSRHRYEDFDQLLDPSILHEAEQRFQDQLDRESLTWLSVWYLLGCSAGAWNIIHPMISGYAWNLKAVISDRAGYWVGLAVFGVMLLMCRLCLPMTGEKYRMTRRCIFCLPIPVMSLGIMTQNGAVMYMLGMGSDNFVWWFHLHKSEFALGQLLALLYSNTFLTLLVAPAQLSIPVGTMCHIGLFTAWTASFFVASRDFGVGQEHGEVWLAALSHIVPSMTVLCIFPFVKARNESMHRRAMLASDVHRALMVREKVKRCQAEHRLEQHTTRGSSGGGGGGTGGGRRQIPLDDTGAASEVRPPSSGFSMGRSAMTAPAAVWAAAAAVRQWEEAMPRTCGGGGGDPGQDCLPETCTVHVEGHPTPQPLGLVQQGQRVLCTDNLTSSVCYKEVIQVETAAGSLDGWLHLSLSDGTCVTLTEDHPLRVLGDDGRECVKPAGEVTANVDRLTGLRLVQRTIVSVERGIPPEAPPRAAGIDIDLQGSVDPSDPAAPRRVALTLEHGERFAVLVSPECSTGSLTSLTAVGSADLACGGLKVRRSMLEYVSVDAEQWGQQGQHMRLRRTASEPALGSDGKFTNVGRGATSIPPVADDASRSVYSSAQSSHCSSGMSSTSGKIWVGPRETSDLLAWSQMQHIVPQPHGGGLPSIGTKEHGCGEQRGQRCKPCLFMARDAEACRDGRTCFSCHSPEHDGQTRSQRRRMIKTRLKLEASPDVDAGPERIVAL